MKIRKFGNGAVSEVFGTIVLLVISVILFTAVYASFFAVEVNPAPPSVNIVGTIEDNNIILAHRGGEQLDLNTKVIISPDSGTTENLKVGDKLPDELKSDDYWDIGEDLILNLDDLEDYTRFDNIRVTVVDIASNTVIMSGTLTEERYADIEISFDVSEEDMTPSIGTNIEINVIAENLGPSDTDDVVVQVNIPDGLDFISSSGDGEFDAYSGVWDIGYLESALITSFEEIVLLDEIIGMARRIGRGIEVNEETLAKDLIINNGPGKSYFELDHTLKNFRKVLWFPTIKDNKPYEVWQDEGKLTMRDRAKNKIDKILASDNPKELSGKVKSELKDVLTTL